VVAALLRRIGGEQRALYWKDVMRRAIRAMPSDSWNN
jgi:hypothetical protein